MTIFEELSLPESVRFGLGDDDEIEVHIVSMFMDTWCNDTDDDEGNPIEVGAVYLTEMPESVDDLCRFCVREAREDSG